MAHEGRDLRDDARQRHLLTEQGPGAGEGRTRRTSHACARRIEQPHDRNPLAQHELAHAGDLLFVDLAHRPGHHREVVGDDRHRTAVDVADAGDATVRREAALGGQAGIHVVGELPVLHEGSGVDEALEPLSHRQLAEAPLPLDAFGSAHLQGALLALRQIGQQRGPLVAIIWFGHRAPRGCVGSIWVQRPVQRGGRFSRKAVMPSAASSSEVFTVRSGCSWASDSSAPRPHTE